MSEIDISKILADSVELYGKEFIAEQTALRSEQSRQKSIEAYKAFTNDREFKMDKQERLEIVNNLIKFISERGRRFFYKKDTRLRESVHFVAYMKLKNGRVYFVDDWTEEDVYAYPTYKDRDGFSHGGTLWALICDFSDYIRNGGDANGGHGYAGLYSEHWGYDEDSQKEIIQYAKEIGYLKAN